MDFFNGEFYYKLWTHILARKQWFDVKILNLKTLIVDLFLINTQLFALQGIHW